MREDSWDMGYTGRETIDGSAAVSTTHRRSHNPCGRDSFQHGKLSDNWDKPLTTIFYAPHMYLLPALCPHIPRVFGNAETPNNAAKSWKVGTIVGKVPGFSPPSEKSTSFDRRTLLYAPCIAPVALTVLAHLVLTIVAYFALTFLAFRRQQYLRCEWIKELKPMRGRVRS